MKIHNKLVRDKIADIITSSGKMPHTRTLDTEQYITELERKLDEECAEYHADKSAEELADILEVVYALAKAGGTSVEELEKIRQAKAQERGGFEDRLYLEYVE